MVVPFRLKNRIQITDPSPNVDEMYGNYASVAAACTAVIPALREKGRTVGILVSGSVVEYWWKSGVLDSDLVVKSAEVDDYLPLSGGTVVGATTFKDIVFTNRIRPEESNLLTLLGGGLNKLYIDGNAEVKDELIIPNGVNPKGAVNKQQLDLVLAKIINAISVTGDSNKTITLTREDGSILTATFLDKDTEYPDDVINTLTFNANNDGVLIAVTSEGEVLSVSMDGRYSLLGHKHSINDIVGLEGVLSFKARSEERRVGKECPV